MREQCRAVIFYIWNSNCIRKKITMKKRRKKRKNRGGGVEAKRKRNRWKRKKHNNKLPNLAVLVPMDVNGLWVGWDGRSLDSGLSDAATIVANRRGSVMKYFLLKDIAKSEKPVPWVSIICTEIINK